MKYIASFDIGTTNVKGILVNEEATIFLEKNMALTLVRNGDSVEQEPQQWYDAITQISASWFKVGIKPKDIALVTFSGQMQDCIPVGEDLTPLRPAILYSDGRATEQSRRLHEEIGESQIHELTENHMDGTLTFPKILWLQEHEEDVFRQTKSFLVSSKDYAIARLTGVCATDPTSAATTGCMDIRSRSWIGSWLELYGVKPEQLPTIVRSDEIVGYVTEQGAKESGFAPGTPVLCGIGDAGSATLGAGIYEEGEIYAYIGTTGWVAAASSGFMNVQSGAFNLAYVEEGRQVAIAPLSNAGNAHQWAMNTFGSSNSRVNDALSYQQFEQALERTVRGKHEVLFLPYLNGERCPVQDVNASGCFLGLKPTTTKEEMGIAVLEGVAFAMRQVLELVAEEGGSLRVTLIGGGAKSKAWCQIIADVLQCDLAVPKDSQYLPSLGAAALGFRQAGRSNDYASLCRTLKGQQQAEVYSPSTALKDYYERQFDKYKRFYPAVAPLFV